MNPLIGRLAALRRRLRWVTTMRGAIGILAVLLASLLVAGWLDWHLQLPTLIRALLLGAILTALGCFAFKQLLSPLTSPSDDLSLALRVEEQYPDLNDSLASTVEFLRQPEESDTAGSTSLRRVAVHQALRLSEQCDFRKVVSTRGLGLGFASLIAVLCVSAFLLFRYPAHAETAVKRLLVPFGGHTWTVLRLPEYPHRIAQGQPFAIQGSVAGVVRPKFVEVELDGMFAGTEVVEVRDDGSWVFPLDMTQQQGEFKFRIRAYDTTYPSRRRDWHDIAIVPPPKWTLLNDLPSPQIELFYPSYTGLSSPKKLTPGNRHVAAVYGTKVRLKAAVDRPLAKAWVEYHFDQINPVMRQGLMLSPLGASHGFGAISTLACSRSVWGRFPAELSAHRKRLSIDFFPPFSGEYRLWLEDEEGLREDYFGDLLIQKDPIPQVTLNAPSHNQDVLPGADITLDVLARDDQYGLRSVYVELRRKDELGNWIDKKLDKIILYRNRAIIEELRLAALPLVPALRLQKNRFHGTYTYSIAGLTKPGESLVVQAYADDFNDIVPNNPPGSSHAVELRIVDRSKLDRIIEKGMRETHKKLIDLLKTQDKALKLADEVKDDLGDDDEGNHDKLAEAKELQKQIQRRVGTSDEEGLRAEIKRLRNTIEANKLPPSAASDRLRTLEHELGRITQEDLQRIEPNLAEAMKDISLGEDALPTLEKARELQKDAKKSLEELVDFLDPWANISDVKAKAGDILDAQKELQKQTEQLQLLQEEIDNADQPLAKAVAEGKFEEGLKRAIEAQKHLAEQAEDLLNMLEAVKKRIGEERKDEPVLELLQEALKEGKKSLLADKMRQAARDLSQKDPAGGQNQPAPKLHDAISQQRKAAAGLERLVEALEENRDQEIARLRRKQQEQQQPLEELVEKLEKLRRKIDAAGNDPERLKKLAEEQRQLQEEVKKRGRELARLQAEDASRALNRAARKMEQATKRLGEGQPPGDEQQGVEDDLKDAKEKLEDAENRLAREQLARIADRLKGFRKRQDAAIVESERLHREVTLEQQKWTTQHLRSLRNLADDQDGLGREVLSLRDKLEGADVFVHLLKQSVEAMKKAAEIMREERSGKAALRLGGFAPEELADEEQTQQRTLREQRRASRKLRHLIEALKKAEPRKRRMKAKADGGEGQKQPGQSNKLQGPGDGIPPMAQLKALREEQFDIHQRTERIRVEQRNFVVAGGGVVAGTALPSKVPPISEEQRSLLERIRADQQGIRELFERILAKKTESEEQ